MALKETIFGKIGDGFSWLNLKISEWISGLMNVPITDFQSKLVSVFFLLLLIFIVLTIFSSMKKLVKVLLIIVFIFLILSVIASLI